MQEINIKMTVDQYKNTMLLLHNLIQLADDLKGKFPEGNDMHVIFGNFETSLGSIQTALSDTSK